MPHPIVWLILYIPFGGLFGFVSVALTFLATQHGLSIGQGALIVGSQVLISWLKWLWAPLVDITLSPKRWYIIANAFLAVAIFVMACVPLGKDTLNWLLLLIATASLGSSVVGMAVEAMVAGSTASQKVGVASAWLQAGNLCGLSLGGALGLFLLRALPQCWMTGVILGLFFFSCSLALLPLPDVKANLVAQRKPLESIRAVMSNLWKMLKTRDGFLTGLLCVLPVATGAAESTLTLGAVAGHWGAGAREVELVQGILSGVINSAGCFAGGWICDRYNPRVSYAFFGLALAAISIGMALSPATVSMYVLWNLIYAFGVGLCFTGFTAMSLKTIDRETAATGYNVFASLSNFPVWWLGLLLAWVVERDGARAMLMTEALLGVFGVIVFLAAAHVSTEKKLVSAA